MVAQYISICLFYFLEINYIYKVKINFLAYKPEWYKHKNHFIYKVT